MFDLTRASLGLAVAAVLLSGCKPADEGTAPAASSSGDGSAASVTDVAASPVTAPGAGDTARRAAESVSTDLGSAATTLAEKPAVGAVGVVVTPTSLDLGQIPTNDAAVGVVTLVNNGDTPRTLRKCSTTCGCTTTNCPTGQIIEPGEELEVEIKLNGGTAARKLDKVVTFVVSDQSPIKLNVHGESISFVTVEPEALDPETSIDGRFTLSAIDDEPFSVRSIYPPIVEGLPTDSATSHELAVDWERWRELGSQRKILFTLDHPKSEKVYGRVTVPRPTVAATTSGSRVPLPGRVSLDAMLNRGDTAEAVRLIAEGEIDPAVIGGGRQYPLGLAAKHGNIAVMEALLDASADIDAVDRTGKTAVMWAAQSKNAEAVRLLLDAGADISITDNIGSTALSWGAGFGDAATVTELIEAGAVVEVPGSITGFTPLIWASGFGEAGSVAALVEAGANIGAADSVQGATPLMHAARTGRVDNLEVLLEAGAALEDRDATGKTVFLMAAANSGGSTEVIQLLIDAGADIHAVDNQSNNAIALANKRTDIRSAEVVEMLEAVLAND